MPLCLCIYSSLWIECPTAYASLPSLPTCPTHLDNSCITFCLVYISIAPEHILALPWALYVSVFNVQSNIPEPHENTDSDLARLKWNPNSAFLTNSGDLLLLLVHKPYPEGKILTHPISIIRLSFVTIKTKEFLFFDSHFRNISLAYN